jgi:hypothetical protein
MSKKFFRLLLFAAFFTMFWSAAALASGSEFIINNKTDSDLYDLYITPTKSAARAPNALKDKSLFIGKSLRVIFENYDSNIILWDIWGINCCGEILKWQNINLNKADTITLQQNGAVKLDKATH